MNNNQFVISIGAHKKVIYAKILSESKSMTCVTSMANTHTNRRLVAEKEVSDIKTNHNCTVHTYKIKNHKYKTVHKCLVYNFMNTQERLMFMDNLVKFLASRRYPNTKKPLQIYELTRTKGKDMWTVSTRKLRENPHATVFPRPKVYYSKKKKCNRNKESCQVSPQTKSSSDSNSSCISMQRTILQIPVPRTGVNVTNTKKKSLLDTKQRKKLLYLQKKALMTQSRPVTRSITRKAMQSASSKNIV